MKPEEDYRYKTFLKELEIKERRIKSLEPIPAKRHLRKDKTALRILEESAQLFADGKFRWSIVASIAMLEYLLKKKVQGRDFDTLITEAKNQNLIENSDFHYLHGLRFNRNNIIHEIEKSAEENDAKIILLISIKIFTKIISPPVDNNYSFELFKQDGDDHYWDKILDLNNYRYSISFTPHYNQDYWRFGIRFSNEPDVNTSERHSPNFPLFHFTKNTKENNLRIHRLGKFKDSNPFFETIFLEGYKNEEVSFLLSKHEDDSSLIFIFNKKEHMDKHPNLGTVSGYSYAQLSAWGDGAFFRINVKVIESEKV